MTNSTKGVLVIRVGMMRVFFLVAVALVSSAAVATVPSRAHADAVVGRGTPNSCTEASLDAALGCNPSGSCSGNGNVTFNCGGGPVTITVTSLETIVGEASIDGGGLVTLDGGGTIPLFVVNDGTLSLSSLIITGGVGGTAGAISISAAGTLTVTNCTFSGNTGLTAGAIFNGPSGTLTVTNSTFSGNTANSANAGVGGGAIFSSGPLAVTNSTFSGNTANGGDGGAIFSYGTLTVTNSTFSGNTASYADGLGGDGGAIADTNAFAAVNVTNSTFSGNSANGGNGGAIYWSGNPLGPMGHPVTVTNSIFSNSTGGNCYVDPYSIIVGGTGHTGAITDGGHNLEDGESCGFRTVNGSLSSTNAMLDPTGLQNNGGATQTIALEPGSPAIDSGDQAVCATAPVNNLDQRGFVRPGAGHTHCSIGAYEAAIMATATPTVTATRTQISSPTVTRTRSPTVTWTPAATSTPSMTPTQEVTFPGDADCNNQLNADDVAATETALFDPIARALCAADCNQDGRVTAADLTCVVKLLSSPSQ